MDSNGFIPRAPAKGNITAIRAKTWNAIADVVNGGRVDAASQAAQAPAGGMNAGWVWVKNTSGSDRSRFDCMALGDPVMNLTNDGQVDVLFKCDTADPDASPAILLEPIADGRVGRAVIYGLCLAKVSIATSTSLLFAEPQTSDHNLKAVASGKIKLLKAPSTSAITLLPVVVGVGGAGEQHFIYSLTDDMGASGSTADIYELQVPFFSTGLVESGATLKDTLGLGAHQVTGGRGICVQRGDEFWVITPECEPEEFGSGTGTGGPL
jgi:hypothetical protein